MNFPGNIVAQRDGAGELIVWIILGVLWAVAQIVTRTRQKRRMDQAPDSPERPAAPHLDLEEFFEQLQKQHEEAVVPPPAQRAPAPRAAAAPPPRAPSPPPLPKMVIRQMPPPPRPKPVRRAPAPVVRQPERPKRPRVERTDFTPIPELAPTVVSISDSYPAEGTTRTFRSGMPAVRSGFEIRNSAMKGVRLMPDAHRLAAPDIRRMFGGRKAMKQSLVGRFVLAPPRALQPWDFPEA